MVNIYEIQRTCFHFMLNDLFGKTSYIILFFNRKHIKETLTGDTICDFRFADSTFGSMNYVQNQ